MYIKEEEEEEEEEEGKDYKEAISSNSILSFFFFLYYTISISNNIIKEKCLSLLQIISSIDLLPWESQNALEFLEIMHFLSMMPSVPTKLLSGSIAQTNSMLHMLLMDMLV